MKVLIFEDEIPAKEKLLSFIHKGMENVEIVGWARSIKDAITLLSELDQVDLIFSDIELLDGTAFEIFRKVQINCPIIFCSAFDQYLFKAFQTNGIAYLLKPYSEENFMSALDKYRSLFEPRSGGTMTANLLQELKSLVDGDRARYKTRFTIKKKNGIKLLNTSDIVNFEASGDFSFAFDNNGFKHIVNSSLGEIANKIDPAVFFRINRSEIINIDYLESIEAHFKNRLLLKLKHREDCLQTSSTKTPEFRIWLDQ